MAECIVCGKLREKKANIIYEDDNLAAILPTKPATPGHIKILPKKHYTKLDEMTGDLVQELFFAASFSSATVFETFKAQGSNIILNEGEEHLAIDVLPRRENDGLNFFWKPKPGQPEEMDQTLEKVKENAFAVGKEYENPAASPEPERIVDQVLPMQAGEKGKNPEGKSKDDKGQDEDENYLIRQLRKIP